MWIGAQERNFKVAPGEDVFKSISIYQIVYTLKCIFKVYL